VTSALVGVYFNRQLAQFAQRLHPGDRAVVGPAGAARPRPAQSAGPFQG
jgi:hypothetical protein